MQREGTYCTCISTSPFSQSDESAHTATNPCFETIAFEVELFLKSQFQRLFSINYFRFLHPTKANNFNYKDTSVSLIIEIVINGELLSKHIRHFMKTQKQHRSWRALYNKKPYWAIRHFVKMQNQQYPLWHVANRYLFQCIKRRMAIRHFVKTESSY